MHRVEAANVGDTLFGDDNVDRVFGVVDVRYHRHDGADETVLSHRRAAEDAQVAVASEVARTANTVHHLGAGDVSRVDVTEYVGFESSVHSYHAEATDKSRVVRYFSRAKYDVLLEVFDILVEVEDGIVRERHRAGAHKFTLAALHEFEHSVLHHLGVHGEWRNFVACFQTGEHGVSHVAHAALDWEEFLRNTSVAYFVDKE